MNLRREGFSYDFIEAENNTSQASEAVGKVNRLADVNDAPLNPGVIKRNRIDFNFQHCNQNAQITCEQKSSAYINYYLRKTHDQTATHVYSYNRIVYSDLYPGIDVIFQFTGTSPYLHYEFVIHPDANISDIQMLVKGCRDLFINANQELVTESTIGYCKELKPIAFTENSKRELPCSFHVRDQIVSFDVSNRSHETIIIDPNIIWSTYYGNTGNENVAEIAEDTSGNPVLIGYTTSTTGLTTEGSWQQNYYGGDSDFFLMRFSSDGSLKWCTYFGGDSADLAYAGAVDQSGNIYVLGSTNSQNGIAYGNAYQPNYSGGNGDMVAAKFDSAGTLLWATYGGGNAQDDIRGGTIDAHGNLITVGFTKSDTGIATPGAYQEVPQDSLGGDAHIEKWTPQGQKIWGTYFGGNESDRAHSVTTDPQGNICLAGTTSSTSGLATSGTSQSQFGGSIDLFLAKCDSNGFRIWASYLGGADLDRGRGIATDESGNIYVTGYTYSDDNISTPGAFQEQWHPGYSSIGNRLADGLIAKFSSSGQKLWGTYYGGEGDETLRSLKLDNSGHVYVFGSTQSDSVVASPDAFQLIPSPGSAGEGLLAKFDTNGHRIWGTYFSDTSDCAGIDMEWDPHGFLYLAGTTQTPGYFITPNAIQDSFSGGLSDAFITKLYPGEDCFDPFEANDLMSSARQISVTTQPWMIPYTASLHSANDQDWFNFKTSSVNNYFKVQLTQLPGDYDLYAYDSLGELVGESHNSGLADELVTVYYGQGNVHTYFINVSSVAGEFDANACYALQVILYQDSVPTQSTLTTTLIPSPSFFPNPAADNFIFDLKGILATGTLQVSDIEGKIVYSAACSSLRSYSVDVSSWQSGIYFVRFITKEKSFAGKLLVTH